MRTSIFLEVEFFALILFSVVLPVGIYAFMMWKKAISRLKVLLFGTSLIALSGVSIFLLQRLTEMAKNTSQLYNDNIFTTGISVALYLLPALFAGIGVNLISHVLITHLSEAEARFDRKTEPDRNAVAANHPTQCVHRPFPGLIPPTGNRNRLGTVQTR